MEVDTALLDRMAPPSLDFNADWTCPKRLLHVLMLCEAPPSGATYSLTARRNVVPPRSHPHPIADGGRGRGTNRSRSQSLRGGGGQWAALRCVCAIRAGDSRERGNKGARGPTKPLPGPTGPETITWPYNPQKPLPGPTGHKNNYLALQPPKQPLPGPTGPKKKQLPGPTAPKNIAWPYRPPKNNYMALEAPKTITWPYRPPTKQLPGPTGPPPPKPLPSPTAPQKHLPTHSGAPPSP